MNRILFLLLASFLVLAACGQEESKSEDKKEIKSSDKESKKGEKKSDNSNKDNKKSDEEKSITDDKSSEQVANNEEKQNQQAQNDQYQEEQQQQEPVQSQERQQYQEPQTQEEVIDNPARDQVINEGIDMDNPTDEEIERMRELSKDSPHGLQNSHTFNFFI